MSDQPRWTKTGLEAIVPPVKGRAVYHDPDCPNLILTVTEKGTKTFSRYGRVHGRPERIRIGAFPAWSIQNARIKCQALTGDIARGMNPAEDTRQKRSAKTLADAWDWYFENHSKPHKRSWKKDLARWDNHLKGYGHVPLRLVTHEMVNQWHQKIGVKAPQQANLVVAMLQSIFRCAIKNQWVTASPCAGITRFKGAKHTRYLRAEEMATFFEKLDNLKPNAKACVLLCLMTGARRSNVCAMTWSEIDFEEQRWTIPAEKSKNKRTLHIPLSSDAIEVLMSRRANGSSWVFPSTHSVSGHMTEVKKFWAKLLADTGLEYLRMHDLRHTVASWQANRGVSMRIIQDSLAQSTSRSTERYAHLSQDPVRESLAKTFEDIKAAADKKS